MLIVSEDNVTVCFITTQLKWQTEFDILISPDDLVGLKKPSLICLSKITTLDKDLVLGKLGILDKRCMKIVNTNLIRLLKSDLG
ncbi:MAG: type II toxin-antitoxin system PemK/MazF family toxin [Bacteroidales bacterium]|nr:type II toxin-antitoxin system PemK/MazF family toxin [Bacteroidales bacterium]